MSRNYEASISIENLDEHSPTSMAVRGRPNAEWDWQANWTCDSGPKYSRIVSHGEGYLYSGEFEEEFVERIARLVWKTAGTYLQVIICMTYLEELPFTSYLSEKWQYDEWLKSQPEPI